MGLFMLTPSSQLVDAVVEAVVPLRRKPLAFGLLTEEPFADFHGKQVIPILDTSDQELCDLSPSHKAHSPVCVERTRSIKSLNAENLLTHLYPCELLSA